VDNPDTIQRADIGQPSRRGLIVALGIGGMATAFAVSARPAAAQEGSTTTSTPAPTTTAVPVPTTTAPPQKPTRADLELLRFAETVERTAARGYLALTDARLAELGFDDPTTEVFRAITGHHRAYAEAISALHGPTNPRSPSDEIAGALGIAALADGDGPTVLEAAQNIEEILVGTHLDLIGTAQSTNTAALLASLQIVEARHAAVLARLRNLPYGASAQAFEDAADSLSTTYFTPEL